ncbi:MAG: hypothetical protein A3I66_01375 [Burkholderiales bacterium RIFCSPLOWO2_02_FULL_57_36]|nr:MAG: hypothetical protein A3I66_01375 [Burkholderiales bacterium RIFCSPLOWO2_02_FULL_57_36]
MLEILLMAWCVWVSLNLALILVASFLIKPNQPCFTGLVVIIPTWLYDVLDQAEIDAVIAHEHGHRYHGHVWENFLRLCVFMPQTDERRREQEFEADHYAEVRGHRQALASALLKFPGRAPDRQRVEKLTSKT